MKRAALVMVLAVLLCSPAQADREVRRPRIFASTLGMHYARSVPAPNLLDRGSGLTRVFRVGDPTDSLEFEFSWYASRLFLHEIDGALSVVRIGPWPEGHQACEEDLALALYLDGELLTEYSTLAIAGGPERVSRSATHYQVFQRIHGFRHRLSRDEMTLDPVFEVRTSDGRTLTFDPRTGKLRTQASLGELFLP